MLTTAFADLVKANIGQRGVYFHFEVILAGYKTGKNGNNFLNKLADSQAPRRFFNAAARGVRDDLFDVISRTVSGCILTTGPKGYRNA